MEKKSDNNAIEVTYDGMENITYEKLKRGVIYADIGCDGSDMVMDILPARHYEGKTRSDDAKIGFTISAKCCDVSPSFQDKIVFDIDGERLKVDAHTGHVSKYNCRTFTNECTYSSDEIIGMKGYKFNDGAVGFDQIVFDLQPDDIKRIAEAKNVDIYFDSDGVYNANGGSVNSRNGYGKLQIEGIQGVMKRAYHHFVDETCYADYCESKQKAIKKEKQRVEAEKKQQEQKRIAQKQAEAQAQQEAVEREQKASKRRLTVFLISLVLLIIGFILFFSDVEGGLWLVIPSGIAIIVCLAGSKRYAEFYDAFKKGTNGEDYGG